MAECTDGGINIIISLIRGCQLTIHEERQAQYSIENCAASIAADYCRRRSAIVCDMVTKFELLE